MDRLAYLVRIGDGVYPTALSAPGVRGGWFGQVCEDDQGRYGQDGQGGPDDGPGVAAVAYLLCGHDGGTPMYSGLCRCDSLSWWMRFGENVRRPSW